MTFTAPMVLDYRNDSWKFQPTDQLTGSATPSRSTFGDTRERRPEPTSAATLRIAPFNVLNYFTDASVRTSPRPAQDVHVLRGPRRRRTSPSTSCSGQRPVRAGRPTPTNLERQQAKIVAAINRLGADVVSLEEIENSAAFGHDRDAALRHLVDALNADAGCRHVGRTCPLADAG